MRSREQILSDLISLDGNLSELKHELAQYSWDLERPVLIIGNRDLINILAKYISQKISVRELEGWADAIECRDDLGFENEEAKEFVYELANPDINGKISKERVKQLINILTSM